MYVKQIHDYLFMPTLKNNANNILQFTLEQTPKHEISYRLTQLKPSIIAVYTLFCSQH